MRRTRVLVLAAAALILATVAFAGSLLQFSLTVGEAFAQSSAPAPGDAAGSAQATSSEIVLPGGSVRPPAPEPGMAPTAPGISRQGELRPGQPALAGQSTLDQQGVNSDAAIWNALRHGAKVSVSIPDPNAAVLVRDDGMRWLEWRGNGGPLQHWGGVAMLAMVALLLLFYLLRGPIRIRSGRSGISIERFKGYERFAHWLLAISFIVLALTGLNMLYGKDLMVTLFAPADDGSTAGVVVGGAERFGWGLLGEGGYERAKGVFAATVAGGKWLHNNVAWAFMLGLVVVFVLWVAHNIPGRKDLKWIARGGGFIGNVHVEAKKFNAGQKLVFWAVILLGASISLSGIALLFPYQAPMFGKTFAVMNETGISGLVWGGPLPVELSPVQEMQYAQIWHSVVAFAMVTVIIAHIYIGTLGMEGAFSAMGTGRVDRNWAKEHHSLWVAEEEAKGRLAPGGATTPAE